MKVYVVTATDHLKFSHVCKVFSSKTEARKYEEKLLLAEHKDVGERYSRVELFERTVDCPEAV